MRLLSGAQLNSCNRWQANVSLRAATIMLLNALRASGMRRSASLSRPTTCGSPTLTHSLIDIEERPYRHEVCPSSVGLGRGLRLVGRPKQDTLVTMMVHIVLSLGTGLTEHCNACRPNVDASGPWSAARGASQHLSFIPHQIHPDPVRSVATHPILQTCATLQDHHVCFPSRLLAITAPLSPNTDRVRTMRLRSDLRCRSNVPIEANALVRCADLTLLSPTPHLVGMASLRSVSLRISILIGSILVSAGELSAIVVHPALTLMQRWLRTVSASL